MIPSKDQDLREYVEFKGLRNNVSAVGFDLGDFEAALNVDLDDALILHRRKGHSAPVLAGAYHSLWADGALCLAVLNNELVQIRPDWSTVSLRTGLTPNRRLSYAAVADRAYYSNGVEQGVVQGGQHRSWGIVPPLPASAVVVGGALRPGRYQYSMTYLRQDGQESGAPRAGVVELTEIGGFELTLPVSSDPTVTQKAVYVSDCDGETLYLQAAFANSVTSFSVREWRSGSILTTQFLAPPPVGDHIAYANGRLLVAVGNRLYPSESYAPELFDLRKGYSFLDRITMVAPLEDGTWLGTASEIVWLPNAEPEKWEFKRRAQYGAISGTAYVDTAEAIGEGESKLPAVYFATAEGLCAGLSSGQLVNFTAGRFAYPVQERGAGILRNHRGTTQFLVTLQGAETAGNVAA